MRPLLIDLPAWVAGLAALPIVIPFILQLNMPKKWRLPAAGAGAIAVAALVANYWNSSLPIHAYGVTLAVAAVVAVTVGVARAPLAGFDKAETVDFGLYVVLWGVIGARIFHVIEFNSHYFSPGKNGLLAAVQIWNGGLVFYGGMIGAMCYTTYFALRRPDGVKALVRMFDLGAPCVLFGLAFGRIGCFLNGCCFGASTGLACGVAYPQGSALWQAIHKHGSRASAAREFMGGYGVSPGLVPHTAYVHPQQLYAALAALALGIFLSWVFYKSASRKWRAGTVSVCTLLTYPVVRFILEGWFRSDTEPTVRMLPFTISQYVSVIAFAAGIVWGIVLLRARTSRAGSGGRQP